MTHDELLAKINEPNPIIAISTQLRTELAKNTENYLITAFQEVGINPSVVIQQNKEITELKNALRAVVELHKPERIIMKGFKTEYWCMADNNEPTPYPCPTIQAIEKELG